MNKLLIFTFFIIFSIQSFGQAANTCGSATTISSSAGTCSSISGNVYGATRDGSTTTCQGTVKYDVWYKFVAQSSSPTLTLSGVGTNFKTPGLQVLTGCGGTEMACGASPLATSGLNIGTTYYIRIYSTSTSGVPTSRGGFTLCILDPDPAPSNDDCSNALSITTATSCSAGASQLTNQTLYGATVAGAGITSSCGTKASQDVWYKFVAKSLYPTVTVNNLGGSWGTHLRIQLFSSTSPCTGLSEVSCASNAPLTVGGSGLQIGGTYYIRIHKDNTTAPSGSAADWKFDICVTDPAPIDGEGSRMREVFGQSLLSPPNLLNDPWEIAYGPDGYLWITEAKGYKVYRMNPATGEKTMVLDISRNSTFLADQTFDLQFDFAGQGNPQGGLAGLAIHPEFNSGKKFVYISYIHKYINTVTSPANGGVIFRNQIVKFTYDEATNKLGSPETLCDTLPGSSDHNSQRMIIAPVGGTNYLFYAQGDMGAGQFGNAYRPNHAQDTNHYEGKILRFNLETDGDGGLNKWIPNDNPFNNAPVGGNPPTLQSAVWATGIRNNQGFAYAKINGVPYLYGSSHGPFSDDEMNIIERAKNYGHPRVIGFSSDHNYDAAKAGGLASALPLIYNETKYASDTIGAGYGDPIYCFYAPAKGTKTSTNTIQYIYNQVNNNNNDNSQWPSLAPSGMEIYTNSMIPGWKNSLVIGSLKGGRVIRLKLTPDGSGVVPGGSATDKVDTINYFRSTNRFRDVAISPDGKTIYTIIDKSSTTSGPTTGNPIISACAGCVQKYTFLGYDVNTGNGNRSYIPNTIPIAAGKDDAFETANKVVINAANGNNNLWVPITDTNSNIVAEINAQGLDLDTVTTTIYTRTGTSRIATGKKYLNRNLTISPKHQPGGTVWIRLYISKTEFDALVSDGGVAGIAGLKILKNKDSCKTAISSNTTMVNTTVSETFGGSAYVLQGDISSFSSFYFGGSLITLPLELLTFKGALKNDAALLQWETDQEVNTSHFIVERSIDGSNFSNIGTVTAIGSGATSLKYDYTDYDAIKQSANLLYYRLKMVDKDGAYTYSNIISIALPYVAGRVTVSPNPFAGEVRVDIAAAVSGKAQWKLIDNNGHVVLQGSEHVTTGANQLRINTAALSSGTYYLTVSGAGVKQQVKIQKQ